MNRQCLRCMARASLRSRRPSVRSISLVSERMRNPKDKSSGDHLTIQPHRNDSYEDAYKIAEKALGMLKRKDDQAVMRLIRMNHDLDLTVTWNYLIRYKIAQGKLNAAFSDFQNMKKRQHFPNSHTYTILLDGLANLYEKSSREKLETVIRSLLEDPRITPRLIHLNAALQVCSKVKEPGLGYQMLDRFAKAGVRELDAKTYDTLLLMIRKRIEDVSLPSRDSLTPHITPEARQQLEDVLGIWKDVESAWQQGNLVVDTRLLSTYSSIMIKGSVQDAESAIATIARLCNLPEFEMSHQHQNECKESDRRGRILPMDKNLFTNLLMLAEKTKSKALVEHYWQNAKAASRGPLDVSIYEARLRSLRDVKSPDMAVAILEEMKREHVQIGDRAIFLALQCHFSHSKKDLKSAYDFLIRYADPKSRPELLTIPVITTFSRFIRMSLDREFQAEAIINLLAPLDWTKLAQQGRAIPHHTQRLRECIVILRKTCKTIIGRRADDKQHSIRKFSHQLETVQREWYPNDLQSPAQAPVLLSA